jgi:hypothetical protein
MIKDLLLHTAGNEKKIYRQKRRATATKGEALLVLVRQYSSRRCLPSLSLSLAERRRSFLTASSFGQDWNFWSHPHLWFADLCGVFAVAALAVVRASISGLEAALETNRQLTDRRDRYKAVVIVKLMFLHTLHKAHELSMLQEEELGEEMCCTNHHGDCDFEFLHYLYLGCP